MLEATEDCPPPVTYGSARPSVKPEPYCQAYVVHVVEAETKYESTHMKGEAPTSAFDAGTWAASLLSLIRSFSEKLSLPFLPGETKQDAFRNLKGYATAEPRADDVEFSAGIARFINKELNLRNRMIKEMQDETRHQILRAREYQEHEDEYMADCDNVNYDDMDVERKKLS